MTDTALNTKQIIFFGKRRLVACDQKCHKAWGINNRPRVDHSTDPDEFTDDPDDYAYLTDDELGDAPKHPGTWEGGDTKPSSPKYFPNKWCVRECERSEMVELGQAIELGDFDKRFYNMPWLHEDVDDVAALALLDGIAGL